MEYRALGTSGLQVSVICLGTMTWGQQNSEAQAHAQMDMALQSGVNFFDTAEMYPVPPSSETAGRTEQYIGTWFAARKNREKIILATKVVGRSSNFNYLRGQETRLDKKNITSAIEGSLKRLQTDYIDLYQLHWPDRNVNSFGQLGYMHDASESYIPFEETLGVLQDLVKAGKVRHVGLSNETPYGTMRFLEEAQMKNLPRMQSVQNPYSLLNRTYEIGMAEVSIRANCGLLAYSPLAMGVLSGKYLGGAKPAGSRMALFTRFQRYNNKNAESATARYVKIARDAGLDPAQMALAFVNQQPFVTSNIIGATTLEQLKSNIGSMDVKLSADVLRAIDGVHMDIQNPCP
ncbi:MAG: NADP(H)-dependent aldo-keto reductase [Alphaproteobacteria bacterium]|nr:NADP(H)-dependent aldo-keto reductase [Alphaproteobacteria bacterium]